MLFLGGMKQTMMFLGDLEQTMLFLGDLELTSLFLRGPGACVVVPVGDAADIVVPIGPGANICCPWFFLPPPPNQLITINFYNINMHKTVFVNRDTSYHIIWLSKCARLTYICGPSLDLKFG